MNLVQFTYTKANGQVSNREVLLMKTSEQTIEGIDVSEQGADDFALLFSFLNETDLEDAEAVKAIMSVTDTTHAYRKFLKSRITNYSYTF